MKRTIINLLIATTLFCLTTQAQKAEKKYRRATFGILGGFSMYKIDGNQYDGSKITEAKFKPGFQVGMNVDIPVSSIISFQFGLQVISKGTKSSEKFYKENLDIYYIEMPLKIVFKPKLRSGNFLIGIGPDIAYGIAGKYKFDDLVDNSKDFTANIQFKNKADFKPDNYFLKPIDLSVGLLLGYQLNNNLFFQINGQYGLLDITTPQETTDPNDKRKGKNYGFGLSVGYRFGK
jgi:hypothetical protein